MKIGDFRAAQIAQVYGVQKAVDGSLAKAKKSAQRPDLASLSPEAQEILAARHAVQEAPDVRVERVAELKRQIKEGTYQVDASSLARRLARVWRVEG